MRFYLPFAAVYFHYTGLNAFIGYAYSVHCNSLNHLLSDQATQRLTLLGRYYGLDHAADAVC